MTVSRSLRGCLAVLLCVAPLLGQAATVTWQFSGTLRKVIDDGAHTQLSKGDPFSGTLRFDDGVADRRAADDARGVYRFEGDGSGLWIEIGGGRFFDGSAAAGKPFDLQQVVTDKSGQGRDKVAFSVRDRASVDAFGKTFEPFRNAGGMKLVLNGADDAWFDGDALLTATDLGDLRSATLTLRYLEALSGDEVRLVGRLDSLGLTPQALPDGAPVPLPASGWLLLAALGVLGARRQHV